MDDTVNNQEEPHDAIDIEMQDNNGGDADQIASTNIERTNTESTSTKKSFKSKRNFGHFRNERYNNAYGNYSGGYGPVGGFGPPPLFGPRCPPMFMRGRGYGPGGPPRRNMMEERATRYLMRCGLAPENLKNLPRDLLELIEPDYCGLCGISLISFTMSRLHYISKNHSKNTKRWLSQQADTPYHGLNPKEIPMKSRDLYCELCDVHITSKTHAESHYSGRPHRAIVEGRKNPKNPVLLQRGMESRVDQLVRREKKHLKPLEEAVVEDEQSKTAKSVPPELYCDICKTSVTCTEQMTMHLNGKRHLAREKQHIFKTVTTQNLGGNDNEYADEDETEDTNQGEENTGEGEDKYDWGNGSGNWEDTGVTN